MISKLFKRTLALTLAAALCISGSTALISSTINAAKKAKLVTKKNLKLKVGDKKKIKLKNKVKSARYSYKFSKKKKVISVSGNGYITALKKGTDKVTVTETLKKKTRKVGVIKVTVKNKKITDTINTPTVAPISTIAPTIAPAPSSTVTPTEAPTPKPTRTPLVLDDTSTPNGFDTKKSDVTYGTLDRFSYYSTTVGKSRNANIIYPANYDDSGATKYPVLYLFHGGNGDENDWLDGKPAEIIGNLIAEGVTEEMLVIMPNCRARENDAKNPSDSLSDDHLGSWGNFLNDFRDDLVPYVNDNFPVYTDRDHTAVAGLSMGGRTALYIGFSMPESIAYIGAFSPAYGIFEYENFGKHEDGYFTPETFTLPETYMDNTTCLIMNGANDSMVKNEPERYHNALVDNGVNHYYYLVPGDHEMNVWKNGLYNFLKVVFK